MPRCTCIIFLFLWLSLVMPKYRAFIWFDPIKQYMETYFTKVHWCQPLLQMTNTRTYWVTAARWNVIKSWNLKTCNEKCSWPPKRTYNLWGFTLFSSKYKQNIFTGEIVKGNELSYIKKKSVLIQWGYSTNVLFTSLRKSILKYWLSSINWQKQWNI